MIRPGTEFQIIPRCHPRCSSNKEPLSSPANVGNTCGPQPDLSGSNRQLRSVAQLRLSQPGFQSVTRSLCWTPSGVVSVRAFFLWPHYTPVFSHLSINIFAQYRFSLVNKFRHLRSNFREPVKARGFSPLPRCGILTSKERQKGA